MSTATDSGRVLAPVIGRYGGDSSDLGLIFNLFGREVSGKLTAFYNIGFSRNCLGMGDSSTGLGLF